MQLSSSSSSTFSSCLTDRPIQNESDDNLRATDYATALCNFITNADTPVTIGIQGGWGSGKTSLIKVLQDKLSSESENLNICVLVNAWEHSLFQNSEDKAEVALSLMGALILGLQNQIASLPWIDAESREAVSHQGRNVSKTIEALKFGLLFASKVAAQMLSNFMGTGDVSNVRMANAAPGAAEFPRLAENIHKLRLDLEEMTGKLSQRYPGLKIIFLIDDLDRVPPAIAVEILDITKNIFDIPECVFILAIDYEVVVKGLEFKFGKKDATNEREFRQYFDKIIQIPFTMPVGAYADNVSTLLHPALRKLGYTVNDDAMALLENLAEDARWATGGIPRSIKRIINTLSLLQYISESKLRKGVTPGQYALSKELELKFIIVALHVNFPEIYRRIIEFPNFPQWDPMKLNASWRLNLDINKNELNNLGKSKYFDDPLEKVVYCLSSSSPWLKSQVFNISRLLNRILSILNDDADDPKAISEKALSSFQTVLDDMKIVSIESDASDNPEKAKNPEKTDEVSCFFKNIQNALQKYLPDSGMPPQTKEYAKKEVFGSNRIYEIAMENDVSECVFEWNKSKSQIDFRFWAKLECSRKTAEPVIQQGCKGCAYDFSWNKFSLAAFLPFEESDFNDRNKIRDLICKVAALYEMIINVRKSLEAHLIENQDTDSKLGWLNFGKRK